MNTAGPFRVCPTASKRRRRRDEVSSTIPETKDNPQIEEGEGDDESEELTTPFPSGPTDITLLRSFKTHIAAHIWNGDVRT